MLTECSFKEVVYSIILQSIYGKNIQHISERGRRRSACSNYFGKLHSHKPNKLQIYSQTELIQLCETRSHSYFMEVRDLPWYCLKKGQINRISALKALALEIAIKNHRENDQKENQGFLSLLASSKLTSINPRYKQSGIDIHKLKRLIECLIKAKAIPKKRTLTLIKYNERTSSNMIHKVTRSNSSPKNIPKEIKKLQIAIGKHMNSIFSPSKQKNTEATIIGQSEEEKFETKRNPSIGRKTSFGIKESKLSDKEKHKSELKYLKRLVLQVILPSSNAFNDTHLYHLDKVTKSTLSSLLLEAKRPSASQFSAMRTFHGIRAVLNRRRENLMRTNPTSTGLDSQVVRGVCSRARTLRSQCFLKSSSAYLSHVRLQYYVKPRVALPPFKTRKKDQRKAKG